MKHVSYLMLFLLMCACSADAKQLDRPNILLIMSDDLNTALSGYGHPQCKTPSLDRLASRGVSFERAYCQFPLCGPSRASIMSGQYPLTCGVTSNGGSLRGDALPLPEYFRRNGYWTGRVSKIYHMGVPGNIFTGDNGADHAPSWVERYNVSAMETITPGKAEDVMLHDGVYQYEALRKKWPACRHKGGKFMIPEGNHQGSDIVIVEADGGDEVMADGMAATKAIELLRQRAGAKAPFFLGVGFVRPHAPYVAPVGSYKDYAVAEMRLAEVMEGDLDDIPAVAQSNTNARKYKLDPLDQKKTLRGYYASITYMDSQVGRLLDELDRLGLAANTIVVFMSDHGYHLGEHTMWQKMSLMEESIRVPLIISVPGRKATHARSARIVQLIDVYPTLVELAGLDLPKHLQGESLVPLLNDPEARRETNEAVAQVGSGFCLRTEKWAYIFYRQRKGSGNNAMLYDMEKDPKQYTNLCGHPDYRRIASDMQSRLMLRRDELAR